MSIFKKLFGGSKSKQSDAPNDPKPLRTPEHPRQPERQTKPDAQRSVVSSAEILNKYSGARLDDRQVTELIGMARGMVADNYLSDEEIHLLQRWLVANEGVTQNPLVKKLVLRIEEYLADGVIDDDERADLLETMVRLTANDFEIGEVLKATTLPLCDPVPHIEIEGSRFCFSGTFTYGKRKDCEVATAERNGTFGTLTQKTDFLVIGEYATDSWAQSSFGRKIEKAVEMRDKGIPIHIVSEAHWRTFLH